MEVTEEFKIAAEIMAEAIINSTSKVNKPTNAHKRWAIDDYKEQRNIEQQYSLEG